jgi:hypothetical protein
MLLQGDLQKVFDALYHLGVIDPVLEMDWGVEFAAIESDPYPLVEIVGVVNSTLGNYQTLMESLKNFAKKDLNHLAMIVARELASSQEVKVLH